MEVTPDLLALFERPGCHCAYEVKFTCPMCGYARMTNHCLHDGIQNPCPECKWVDPSKRTPLQFLGWAEPGWSESPPPNVRTW